MTDRDELRKKLIRIFGISNVSFDAPGESLEQEKLFVRVTTVKSAFKDKKSFNRYFGELVLYANTEKLPFGYFQRKIAEADPLDAKDFFFYDLEQSQVMLQNIGEYSLSFIYFSSGQHDPELGTMTSIDFNEGQ